MAEKPEIDIAALKAKLASAKEIEPREHDGSYVLVQHAGKLYYDNFPKCVTKADIDLFYYLVTIRYESTQNKKIRASSLSKSQQDELVECNANVHLEHRERRISWGCDPNKMGMFYGPIGTFGKSNGIPDEDVRPLIELFAWLCGNKDATSEEKIARVETVFNHPIRGFKNGTASIILHCIDPYTFPVINTNQGRDSVYTVLGAEGVPADPKKLNDLTQYASYCRAIQKFRDEGGYSFKNYRVIDLIGFDMPVVHKSNSSTFIEPLEGIPESRQLDALEAFSSEINCLNRVNELLSKVNLFEVLKITRTEIRHSNVLAWLLDACQNHGLKEVFLLRFLGLIEDIDTDSISDLEDFTVERELTTDDGGHIDLLLTSEKNSIVVAIENKIFTGEHGNQLKRYYDHANDHYPELDKYFVYLTPEGSAASDSENWQSVGYAQIAEILDECLEDQESAMSADTRTIIEHYVEAVKKDVLGDDPVKVVAKEIYRHHRLALDAIFQYRPDELTDVMERLSEELERSFDVSIVRTDRSGVLFRTGSLDTAVPLLEDVGFYGDNTACCFGIVANGDTVGLTFRYPSASVSNPDESKLRCDIIESLEGNPGNERWIWSGFEIECSAGDLYKFEDKLKDFVQEAISQAEDFVENCIQS